MMHAAPFTWDAATNGGSSAWCVKSVGVELWAPNRTSVPVNRLEE